MNGMSEEDKTSYSGNTADQSAVCTGIGMSEEDKLLRNLKDVGCDDETIKKFFQLRAGGRKQEQYRLLSMHRALLLDKLHVSQQMIDCLDYLVYAMKKED